jgi:hypothetical protein
VIKSVSFDAADALPLARFWATVLGSDVDEDSTAEKAFVEAAGWGGPSIWFTQVPEPKAANNRMHFDLRAPGAMDDEVARQERLGVAVARRYLIHTVMDGPRRQRVLRRARPPPICLTACWLRPRRADHPLPNDQRPRRRWMSRRSERISRTASPPTCHRR